MQMLTRQNCALALHILGLTPGLFFGIVSSLVSDTSYDPSLTMLKIELHTMSNKGDEYKICLVK